MQPRTLHLTPHTSGVELLLTAVERSSSVSRSRHAVTELQGHRWRPGVRSVVRGQCVVLLRLVVVLVVTVPSTHHHTALTHPIHQRVALRELLVHPAAPVVVGRSAIAVVTLRFLPGG